MQNLCPYISEIDDISHGFFTKRGGVSSGIYDSLNCGYGSGDNLRNVRENREIVAELLGVNGYVLCTASQVHSSTALIVEESWQDSHSPTADALVTNRAGIAIGVLTADCLPVLFVDKENMVIGAAHAGWKGAFSGVIENTISTMQQLGAKIQNITATIGPAIAQESYEISAEFYDNFIKEDLNNNQFFKPSDKNGHYLFNLPAYAEMRLKKNGIFQTNIIAKDTFSNAGEFFSYRRSCKEGNSSYGRQISAIVIN